MDSPLNSAQLVRLLAEPTRRRIVAALTLHGGACSAAEIADATELSLRSVVDAVDRLVGAGLVEANGDSFGLNDHIFEQAARAEAPAKPPSDHGDQPVDIARVLDVAFTDGTLVQWPSKRTKRLVVLDHLAQNFDIGKRYSEAEVNDRLREFNDDVATTRRYLVDEQFLDRGNGQYWRCGGTI